jgi:hypothetical protein
MIGEIIIIGKDLYVKSYGQGTLERLQNIPWYRKLQIFFINYNKQLSIGEVREFYRRYNKIRIIQG